MRKGVIFMVKMRYLRKMQRSFIEKLGKKL